MVDYKELRPAQIGPIYLSIPVVYTTAIQAPTAKLLVHLMILESPILRELIFPP